MIVVRCPLCGVAAHACGPSPAVTPVDIDYPMRKDPIMALTEYTVTKNGVETTMLLSDAHAQRMGLIGKDKDKAASTDDDKADTSNAPVSTAARTTRNKARNETR